MLSSLLRPKKGGRRSERAPYGSQSSEEDAGHDNHHRGEYESMEDDDEDGVENTPLLPIFSAAHLDSLPVYSHTHAIRLLIVQRCETTLTFDQLRSPQVSQFLVKPVQQNIRSAHFSRATLYCLIANCLQFQKEGQMNPGNVGLSRTRAMICELLAMRLIKEFSTRELIDALSYDFDPLQGISGTGSGTPRPERYILQPRSARISTVEVAIRAQAKKFLAHPLVVQQLEAIWAGTIVFHSAADYLHRRPLKSGRKLGASYGAVETQDSLLQMPTASSCAATKESADPILRRAVTLYDSRDASLFKLSRLRVPRYRQIFSTCSFAVLLALFVSVLFEKSTDITGLEILFWFWSAGYMLDELVGFNEQGFGLYIMSVWNVFDLGILLLFVVYYVLRLYGILMDDIPKRRVANMAYDVLASTAVLLFPRLFSVLDHYKYFSQLLIAFRMMAMDLVAILLLIIISCSGFFVAFTLSFSDEDFNAASAAYALFQMVMGFTPAAWEIWTGYNLLGKGLLTLFLFICHFLIVTILITVLTNSFMAVVQNANEEHQFLFAVNTISMVKSDALFSYIPPTNVVGWLFAPLRFCMPFRNFVQLNRLIIKVTHLPILFLVFAYERIILSHKAYDPADLVEQRGRTSGPVPAFSIRGPGDLFSPAVRLREPSVTTFRKDRALEEVFRRPFKESTFEPRRSSLIDVRQSATTNVVQDWMQGMGYEASSPLEQPRSVLERLETRRRPFMRRARTSHYVPSARRHVSTNARSTASDRPERRVGISALPHPIQEEEVDLIMGPDELPQQTDADGDDELLTNDEEDRVTSDRTTRETDQEDSDRESRHPSAAEDSSNDEEDCFQAPLTAKAKTPVLLSTVSSTASARLIESGDTPPQPSRSLHHPKRQHMRNSSTTTILYSPLHPPETYPSTSQPHSIRCSPKRPSTARSGAGTATPNRRSTGQPYRPTPNTSAPRPRPRMPHRANQSAPNLSAPNLAHFLAIDRVGPRKPSFNARALDLASDLGDNRAWQAPDAHLGSGIPASLTTQMMMAGRSKLRPGKWSGVDEDDEEGGAVDERRGGGDAGIVGRIVMARMNMLEEGFREVLKEVNCLRSGQQSVGSTESEGVKLLRKERSRQARGDGNSGSVGGREAGKERFDGEDVAERSSL